MKRILFCSSFLFFGCFSESSSDTQEPSPGESGFSSADLGGVSVPEEFQESSSSSLPEEPIASLETSKAEECIQITQSESGAITYFENICDYRISLLWCGEKEFSDKRCGDGPEGGFFTSSRVLDPGNIEDEYIGAYSWGACVGNVGFGHDKYQDWPDGSYICTMNN